MSIALISKVIGSVRRWHLRRQDCKALSMLNDHLLRDIGIERIDIERVVYGQRDSRPLRRRPFSLTKPVASGGTIGQKISMGPVHEIHRCSGS